MKTLCSLVCMASLAAVASAQQLGSCQEVYVPTTGNRSAVAIDGDTAVVVSGDSVLVFRRSPAGWASEDTVTPGQTPFPGWVVDVDGDTVVASGTGTYVYERSGTSWSQTAFIAQGGAVAVSGDLLAIGESFGGSVGAGAVTLFERTGSSWSQVAYEESTGTWSFGADVALEGDRLIVGAPAPPNYQTVEGGYGGAFVYRWSAGTLTLESAVIDWLGEKDDQFGYVVDIDGDWLVAGSLGPKRIFVFEFDAGSWVEHSQLNVPGGAVGAAAAIDGDRVLVGAPNKKVGGVNTGAARLFVKVLGVWQSDVLLSAQAGQDLDRYGEAVALDGDTAIVAAPQADGLTAGSGASYVHDLVAAPQSYCTAGTSSAGCQATLSAAGSPSSSASSGFVVTASGVEGAVNGVFFFGQNGRQANAWGNGTSLQCVVPPVRRAGLLTAGGTPGQCDGSFSQDLNARWCPSCAKPGQAPVAGSELQVQLWYRDPASTSNQSTSLSDALGHGVCP